MDAWMAMMNVCAIESNAIATKKLACDGSMLNGYTVNETKATENREVILRHLQSIRNLAERAIAEMG